MKKPRKINISTRVKKWHTNWNKTKKQFKSAITKYPNSKAT